MQEIDLREKRITVTGGHGFLGQHVVELLKSEGLNPFVPTRKEYNLMDGYSRAQICRESDIIIHLAAKMGGIGANQQEPATFFYENAIPGIELLRTAQEYRVEKVVITGTVCEYPENTPIPYEEKNLWNGYPEPTNGPYGIAKKAIMEYQRSLFKQYGFNSIHLLMANMYGPGERLTRGKTHVIPDNIRKIYDAKLHNKDFIEAWGTGKATRDFLYVKDAAKAVVLATKKYNDPENPVNIGSGTDISMKELIESIAKLMDFKGEIRWDHTKPDGQLKRLLDTSRAYDQFGFLAITPFSQGLEESVIWYQEKLDQMGYETRSI